ncbi:MAG: flagellar biosynthesis anti-sigma factor FlgM [Candidatus Sulfotelmatobacter sp.]
MRIDPNQDTQRVVESERSGSPAPASGNTASPGSSGALGEDQAQLSGFHSQVQSLVAQASELPETSQGKVEALRQAVVAGKYQPNPDEVAGALFANMVKLAA